MDDPLPSLLQILKSLLDHQVEFILVGGLCGRLQGVPLVTEDIDIVYRCDADNIARLLAALEPLDAHYRGRGKGSPKLKPRAPVLEAAGHNLLMTNAGPLDVLGTIGNNQRFEDLLPHTVHMQVLERPVRMLDLATLIQIKEELGRAKDLAVLPLLRDTLNRRQQQ